MKHRMVNSYCISKYCIHVIHTWGLAYGIDFPGEGTGSDSEAQAVTPAI
jgi:hypothetical protein